MAFPTPVRRGTAVSSTANSGSWTPSWNYAATNGLNTAISAGEKVRWVAVITADGNPTLTTTSTGWEKKAQATDATNAVTQAIFTCETTVAYAAGAAPALVIDSTANEQFSGILSADRASSGNAVILLDVVSAQGSSTNSNPPSITNTSGFARDCNVRATRGGDSTVVATAAPTNYSNLLSIAGGGTNGASTNQAMRQIALANGASEDPGTFTSNTEQWVSFTLLLYEAPWTGSAPNDATNSHSSTQPTLAAKSVISPDSATNSHTATQPSVTDPGAGGGVTWHPTTGVNKHANVTLSNNNLTANCFAGSPYVGGRANAPAGPAAYQFEVQMSTAFAWSVTAVGIEPGSADLSVDNALPGNGDCCIQNHADQWYIYSGGSIVQGPLATPATAANDIITVAVDETAGTVKFFHNGTQVGTTLTGLTISNWNAYYSSKAGIDLVANFAGPFAYPQSGYSAYQTASTPTAAPANATHAHAATSPTIGAKSAVTANDATHGHAATSPTIAAKSAVTPAVATHGHTASQPTLATTNAIAPANASHGLTSTEPTITPKVGFAPADATHGHTASQPTLATKNVIAPDNAAHGQGASSPTVTTKNVLAPDNATHGLSSTQASIGSGSGLAPANATHGHTASQSTIGEVNLAPADATHGLTSSQPTLTTKNVIAPDNAAHGHTSSQSTIGDVNIAPADANQTVTSSQPTLGASGALSPQPATHGLTSTSPTLTPRSTVAPADATNTHTASSPTIGAKSAVAPAGAVHGQAASSPTIGAKSAIAPANATHGHTASSPTLVPITGIVPHSAVNANITTSPTIQTRNVVSPHSAANDHTATSPTLTPHAPLVSPVDSLHGHTAEQPTVIPRAVVSPASSLHIHTATQSLMVFRATPARPPTVSGSAREIVLSNSRRLGYDTGRRRPPSLATTRRP